MHADLEIRAVLVGWRDVMGDIHAGHLPRSRESVQRVTAWALEALTDIEHAYSRRDGGLANRIATLIGDARSEVQGATFHDLADSGEEAG